MYVLCEQWSENKRDMATIKLTYVNELFLVTLGGGGKYLF